MNERALRGCGLLVAWGMALCVGSVWCAPQDSLTAGAAVAPSTTEDNSNPPLPPASDFSRTAKEKVFSVPLLRAYIRESDEMYKTQLAQRTNRFCFTRQRSGPNDPSRPYYYRMIWFEGNRLFYDVFRERGESTEDQLSFIQSDKSIHMEDDVRNTFKEIYGSTFLEHRAWVNWMLTQCKRTGRWVTVPPVKKRAP